MPLIQLETSCSVSDPQKKQALAQTLSALAAAGIGKPQQYVMASVHDNMAMSMSGTGDPCALVTVKSIGGLSKAVNQSLTAQVAQVLQAELGIEPNRVYVTFAELAPTHWGWNGSTFG
jgi:phenylpyruvate tautomerase PptA (4-oxalocrotonate tautomerase family)